MPYVALQLRDVHYAYPGRDQLLRHVGLGVPKGCLTVILGPNGSGKTTLLKIAAGLTAPTKGDARLGDDTPARAALRQGRIGYIPQQLGLVRNATVLQNACMGGLRETNPLLALAGHTPRDVRDRAHAALEAVGLSEKGHLPARQVSGGERQRVAIARTLVQRPDVIVADELIASLDVMQAHAVMEVLNGLKRKGAAILMSLHQIDVALAHADQVAFVVHGSLSNPRPPAGMSAEEARCFLVA